MNFETPAANGNYFLTIICFIMYSKDFRMLAVRLYTDLVSLRKVANLLQTLVLSLDGTMTLLISHILNGLGFSLSIEGVFSIVKRNYNKSFSIHFLSIF